MLIISGPGYFTILSFIRLTICEPNIALNINMSINKSPKVFSGDHITFGGVIHINLISQSFLYLIRLNNLLDNRMPIIDPLSDSYSAIFLVIHIRDTA